MFHFHSTMSDTLVQTIYHILTRWLKPCLSHHTTLKPYLVTMTHDMYPSHHRSHLHTISSASYHVMASPSSFLSLMAINFCLHLSSFSAGSMFSWNTEHTRLLLQTLDRYSTEGSKRSSIWHFFCTRDSWLNQDKECRVLR